MINYASLESAQDAGVAPWTNLVPEMTTASVAVYRDAFPVTQGHLLFVPKTNTDDTVIAALGMALIAGREMVATGRCQAFNVGLNVGAAAGQTVMYPHVHLIPRNTGDCDDPVGGVRGVIPSQQNYKTTTYKAP